TKCRSVRHPPRRRTDVPDGVLLRKAQDPRSYGAQNQCILSRVPAIGGSSCSLPGDGEPEVCRESGKDRRERWRNRLRPCNCVDYIQEWSRRSVSGLVSCVVYFQSPYLLPD